MLNIEHEIKCFLKTSFEACNTNQTVSQLFGMGLIACVNQYRIIYSLWVVGR